MISNEHACSLHFAHANGFPAGSYKQLFAGLPPHLEVFHVDKFAHDPRFPLVKHWTYQVDELIHKVETQVAGRSHANKVVAMGHSFGAVISYMAAVKRPDLFSALIMLDPPLITGVSSWVFSLLRRTAYIDKVTPAGKTKFRKASWQLEEDLVEYFAQRALFKNMHRQCIKDYVDSVTLVSNNKRILHFDVATEANIFRTIPTNLSTFYGKLTMPAALIRGKTTPICIPKYTKPFLRGNSSVQDIQLAQGGHMFPLEYPQETAKAISALLAQWGMV